MQRNHSNRFLSLLASGLMTAVLYLTASAQASAQSLTTSQQATVSNLANSSLAIKKQLALGTAFSAGFAAAAANGTIVDQNAWLPAKITEQHRNDYNAAVGDFRTTDFYTAKQFLLQQAAVATTNMQASISDLASAAVDLQKAVVVNQMVSAITDAPSAKTTQSAIAAAGLSTEITASQTSAYNTSLASVNSYASQAASFFRAANSTQITGNIDAFKATYNKELSNAYASAGYVSNNPYVAVAWGDGNGISQGGLAQYVMSSQGFYAANSPFGAP